MEKIAIKESKNLSKPRAPYSHVVRKGNLVVMSGQVGRAADGSVAKDLQSQFRQLLENTRIVLGTVGAKPEDVVRVTLYMTDMKDKASLNQMREDFFGPQWPAAVAVGVTELAAPEYLIEMDAIAVVES